MSRAFHSTPGRESAPRNVEYATVKAILAQRTDLAILLARDDLAAPVWVPKRALSAHGRITAEKALLKTDIEVGVDLRLALEKGLV